VIIGVSDRRIFEALAIRKCNIMRNLDVALLRTFTIAPDHRSMSAAARALHLTQGAVSQQIRRLESFFGASLFMRNPRGLQLTSSGNAC